MTATIDDLLARFSPQISDDAKAQLESFARLLTDWNIKVNLVSRRDIDRVWERHIVDSLSCLEFLDLSGCRVLDLGTGGGLPGIPLKIVVPSMELVLVDHTRKKIRAVDAMLTKLGLMEAEAIWGDTLEISRQEKHAKQYDVVVTRAVGGVEQILPIADKLLAPKGVVVMWRTLDHTDKLPARFPMQREFATGQTLSGEPTGLFCVGRIGSERHLADQI